MAEKRKFDDMAGSTTVFGRDAKVGRVDVTLTTPERSAISAMASVCEKALDKRDMDWTTYARMSHSLVLHNFGLGPEPAVKCLGCRRFIPNDLITGDHMAPKSDKQALRRAIAFGMDRLNEVLYAKVIAMPLTPMRSDTLFPAVTTIRRYDDTLEKDNRNIQPLCWSCNTRKGNRSNVRLFPTSVLMPLRPNEAPF